MPEPYCSAAHVMPVILLLLLLLWFFVHGVLLIVSCTFLLSLGNVFTFVRLKVTNIVQNFLLHKWKVSHNKHFPSIFLYTLFRVKQHQGLGVGILTPFSEPVINLSFCCLLGWWISPTLHWKNPISCLRLLKSVQVSLGTSVLFLIMTFRTKVHWFSLHRKLYYR